MFVMLKLGGLLRACVARTPTRINIPYRYLGPRLVHIDPDFFLSFLDPKTPCYTQGVYESADETLDVAVKDLLDKAYGAQRAALINPNKANCNPDSGSPPTSDTTYLAAVDKEGNIASLIQSNYSGFGSGIIVNGMGFALQNRGALFVLDPSHPNALVPRKRPFHTIIPAFMERGEVHIGFGIMGGANQPLAHAQFVSDIVDYRLNIQAALEAPRFTKLTFTGCDVRLENRVPGNVKTELEAKGHKLTMHNGYSDAFGGGQAVMRDYASGVNYGASDPIRLTSSG
jgi:gamma-glutamyltranspeptidase/glutathione hydrolase